MGMDEIANLLYTVRPSWTFRCYLDNAGNNVIDDWYQQQPPKLQAKFDTRIRFLRVRPISEWVRPYFSVLTEDCKGLGEIRFNFKNVEYRPLGFFSGQMEFTLVMVAQEKENKFVPLKACEISQSRKAEIENNRRRACDCCLD